MRIKESSDGGLRGGDHPGDDEIAAYIDRGLAPAARARVAGHLASCERCFELYLETMRCLDLVASLPEEGRLAPFVARHARAARRLAAAVAAALVLAAGLGAYQLLAGRPRIDVVALVRTLGDGDGLAENVWTGEVLRGVADEEENADPGVLSFLMGAHLVGFQATVEARDRDAACAAARRVTGVLAQAEFVTAAESEFKQARAALCGGDGPAGAPALAPDSDRPWSGLVEKTSPDIEAAFLPVHLDFGEWAQAGRIAARGERNGFFVRRGNRRFLEWLLEQEDEPIDPRALGRLREIATAWRAGSLGPADYRRLAELFTALLDHYEALGRSSGDFS